MKTGQIYFIVVSTMVRDIVRRVMRAILGR